MRTPNNARLAIIAMIVGLALTIFVTVMPYISSPAGQLISQHVKAGYPSYSESRVASATMIYLIGLTAVGVLGATCWVISIVAAHRGKRWTVWLATGALVVGATIGLFDLMVRDTSGDTGLPGLLGCLGLVPSAVGLFAVVLLWIKPPAQPSGPHPAH